MVFALKFRRNSTTLYRAKCHICPLPYIKLSVKFTSNYLINTYQLKNEHIPDQADETALPIARAADFAPLMMALPADLTAEVTFSRTFLKPLAMLLPTLAPTILPAKAPTAAPAATKEL